MTKNKFEQHKGHFKDVRIIDVMLTQKCNKRCSYCYEQHDKTFGTFTVEKIKKVYDFLKLNSQSPEKYMQFFGGEPLLERPLILDFMRTYKDELAENEDMFISMITNGLLLDREFIEEFASYPNTGLMLSLDTDIADPGLRDTTKQSIAYVLKMAEYAEHNDLPVTIRCTISEGTVANLDSFIEKIVDLGIKQMVIHPLTLSAKDGFIIWTDENWDLLESTIKEKLLKYKDFTIHFSEGVGKVGDAGNCMIGTTMIAVDGEGDYSGCYFFTNQKETLGPDTTLGNIFTGDIDLEKYATFKKEMQDQHISDPKCQKCDLKGYCYQCPAGNLSSTDGPKFRSDEMCQRIVKLFLTLNRDETAKKLRHKLELIGTTYKAEGEPFIARTFFQLAHKIHKGYYYPVTELKKIELPHHEKILSYYFLDPNTDVSLNNIEEIEKNERVTIAEVLATYTGKRPKGKLSEQIGFLHLILERQFTRTL